ncbi:MAG TPA: formylglycine-generating enzyme family protein [Oculatellaceae cyanobacterium]
MTNNNPNQPKEYDAVLGGDAPPLVGGAVLGGIEGVKMRFASAALQQRVTALSEALKYGEAGLDLVIQGLQDESKQVQYTAYSLLEERQEARIKKLLRNYLPWFEFEVVTVDDQGQEYSRCRNVQYFENDQGLEYSRCRSYVQYFEDDLGDGVSLAMVSIPGGTFMMGSPETENMMSIPETEKWRHKNESPQHQVTVAPFFMGKYPITQVQWQAVAALPQVRYSLLNPEPSKFKGENRPVDSVSWYDAVEFCARVSNKTGREYRLPSEAKWEYACRAGTTTPFHFGETITPELANCGNLNKKNLSGTTPVGHFNVANAFGLYDMHGNVCEWCADHWHNNYEGAPTDGSIWLDDHAPPPHHRLLRGGSWFNLPANCRSAFRNGRNPGVRRTDNVGFRVVCAAAWTS